MYTALGYEILALTSGHSGFYKCFCSELSFKPIHYHTPLTVIKECKLIIIYLPPFYTPDSLGIQVSKRVGGSLVMFTVAVYPTIGYLSVGV